MNNQQFDRLELSQDLAQSLPAWRRIHFLGIGGIGMSALARYFRGRGSSITGYDRTRTPLVDQLEAEGTAQISLQPQPNWVEQADVLIHTPAVPADHPDRVRAQELDIPQVKRAAVLGALALRHQTLAVAGAHGKTTTSALLTWLLAAGGADPTAFVGGVMRNTNSNFRLGQSDWLVAEADEFDRSFLHLAPQGLILTSVDADHLDIYHSPEQLRAAYRQLLQQLRPGGVALVHHRALELLRQQLDWAPEPAAVRLYSYGTEQADMGFRWLGQQGYRGVFEWRAPWGPWRQAKLPLPGRHNSENACAALGLALLSGALPAETSPEFDSFLGIHRRLNVLLETPAIAYLDDYAHHPAELAAALQTARELYPKRKLVAVFQPHLYTRTRDFLPDFARVLDTADAVWLIHIYPAREKPIVGINAGVLLDLLSTPDKHLISLNELPVALPVQIQQAAVVLTLGAGDIDSQVDNLKIALAERSRHLPQTPSDSAESS